MATHKNKPGFRHVTAAAMRRLVRNNRGAFLPGRILLVLDELADSDGRCCLKRSEIGRIVGAMAPPVTGAIQVLEELGIIEIERTRPNPWRIVIVHIEDGDEPLLSAVTTAARFN